MSDGLDERLRSLLKGQAISAAGAIQFVNLDPIRVQLGTSWERVVPRVRAIFQSVVERQLGPTDLGMWLTDLAYVIVFGKMNAPEAEVRALVIAAEVTRRLLGEQADSRDLIKVSVIPLSGDKVRPADILDACEKLLTVKPKPSSEKSEADDDPEWSAFQQERQWGVSPAASVEMTKEKEIDLDWTNFGETDFVLPWLHFRYRPIWDVQRQVLSTYFCEAYPANPNDSVPTVDSLVQADDFMKAVHLDLSLLTQIGTDLARLHLAERRVLMVCPVHVVALSVRRTRDRLRKAYYSQTDTIKRDIILELIADWHGMPQGRMTELMTDAKPISRSVMARVDLDWNRFELFRDGGLKTVSVNLSDLDEPESRTMSRLNIFVERANRAGMRSCVYGLGTPSLAVAALAAGVDLVEGKAIHAAVESPEHVFRFDVANLFSTLLGG